MKSITRTSGSTYKGPFDSAQGKKKVFVGLSGGVDSAVSAVLLKDAGYDVTGVFIKVWQPDFLTCTWREERRDAMRVAARLGIPFLFFDFEEEYKKGVADYIIEEYRKGRTPNPDVMCNREIKFGAFWRRAKDLGADYIATGHYAQIKDGRLCEGADKSKDQSYFLWTLTPQDLEHVLFPVGHLQKEKVRKLAKQFDIPVSNKKDSQGICFLGDVDIEDFLSRFIDVKPGHVLDPKGKKIGQHNGALYYTLGERHGFEIFHKAPDSKPRFVIAKDIEANTITVSDSQSEIDRNLPTKVRIGKTNGSPAGKLEARVRYRGERLSVTVSGNEVAFETPQAAAPGQSVVFYEGDACLGGGIIA